MRAHRFLALLLPIATAGVLAGCVSNEPLGAANAATGLEGLVVLGQTTSTHSNLTGELRASQVGLPLPLVPRATPPGAIHEQPLEVPADALFVRFNLTWSERYSQAPFRAGPILLFTNDLDLYILDARGRLVAQGATDAPEEQASVRLSPRVELPLTVRVVNFDNPPTKYNVAVEVVT